MKLRTILLSTSLIAMVAVFTGCGPIANPITEPTYTSSFAANNFVVESHGPLKIFVGADNVVIIDGVSWSSGNSTERPEIRVSGDGVTFKVYNVDAVVATAKTTVYADGCGVVKARKDSTVHVTTTKSLEQEPGAHIAEIHNVDQVITRDDPNAAPKK